MRCRMMVNKITIVPKFRAGTRVGSLHDKNILRPNQAMLMLPGIAVSPKARSVRSDKECN